MMSSAQLFPRFSISRLTRRHDYKAQAMAACFATLISLSASASTLAVWTFESSAPTTSGPISPEIGAGSAVGNTGGIWSNPVGNGSAESWNSNKWDGGDYFQFTVDGTGYDTFEVSWSQIGSNLGPKHFSLSYSLDGISFIWLLDYEVLTNANQDTWSSSFKISATTYGFELNLPKAVAGKIHFRLTALSTISTNGGSVANGGTSRVDDFSVVATAKLTVER